MKSEGAGEALQTPRQPITPSVSERTADMSNDSRTPRDAFEASLMRQYLASELARWEGRDEIADAKLIAHPNDLAQPDGDGMWRIAITADAPESLGMVGDTRTLYGRAWIEDVPTSAKGFAAYYQLDGDSSSQYINYSPVSPFTALAAYVR